MKSFFLLLYERNEQPPEVSHRLCKPKCEFAMLRAKREIRLFIFGDLYTQQTSIIKKKSFLFVVKYSMARLQFF